MNLLKASLMQANREERESLEEAERERLAAEEEVWKSEVLTEWERTCSTPQNKVKRFVARLHVTLYFFL